MFYVEEEIGYWKFRRRTEPVETQYVFHYELFCYTAETVSTWHRERNSSWQTVDKFKGRGINVSVFIFAFSVSSSHPSLPFSETNDFLSSERPEVLVTGCCRRTSTKQRHTYTFSTSLLTCVHFISASLYFNRLLNGIIAAQTFKNQFVTIIIGLILYKIFNKLQASAHKTTLDNFKTNSSN